MHSGSRLELGNLSIKRFRFWPSHSTMELDLDLKPWGEVQHATLIKMMNTLYQSARHNKFVKDKVVVP